MGCVHTTGETQDDREGAGKNVHENCEHNYKPQKSVNSIQNDISNSDVTVKSENVTLKEINFKEVDGEQNSSLMYQISVLNASDIESRGSGSSLSLSDLDTYRKKRFPKWRGYRKCKYCMQDESLQSSFRSSYDTGSFAESSGTNETKQESDKGKRSKMRSDQSRPTPRGLPSRDSCRRCSTKVTKNSNQRNNTTNNNRGGTTSQFINLLAINALDLTAPASDALLKNRKNAWVQLAGHPGSFAPAGPDTIWKKRLTKDNREVKAYQALMNDPAREVVPTFHREVEFNGDFFIEMEDLLHHFHDPNIMDIKMGCRTFLEAEVKNPVLRTDLYEKMVKIDPDAPTEEEHAQKAITKLRYMQFREHESSTASLGFRLEAIRVSGQTPVTDLKKVKNREEVAVVIARFISGKETIRKTILDKLIHIRQCFEDSDFFRTHELIGSSLLVMFDKRGVSGVWMIDFAKTLAVDRQLSHRAHWMLGNHEDGYLTGLDNLIKIFETLTFTSTEMIDNLSFVPDQTQASEVT